CVFEKILTRSNKTSAIKTSEIRREISQKSKVNESEIFIDASKTPSIPLTPSKKESESIILTSKKDLLPEAYELPISEIPLISAISGFMNMLRVYTAEKNRKKVEIAAKIILGENKS
ncbi:MAG TPA: phosphohydrolase, partial [Nitrosopumilaceae archaeon]|nr:phosphohydrolase [Nitrosopumilaceae archaeon]